MFENLGFSELFLIMVLALVVFGPKKLPELGKTLGSTLREFKKATQVLTDEVNKAVTNEPEPAATRPDPPRPPVSPAPPAENPPA